MNLDRLARITDLFAEGREICFGDDESGTPILVWVSKLNSFEEEEARRDGSAARSLRLLGLGEDYPEIKSAREELSLFDKDELNQIVAAQSFDEDYLLAIDDIDSDPEWKEKLSALRMASLLDDADVPDDDDRRKSITELNLEYMESLRKGTDSRQKARRQELADLSMDELQDRFIKNWRNRVGMADFLAEQRVTQIFYALRDCVGNRKPDGDGFVHTHCKHQRLLNERSQVRGLPEDVLEKVVQTIVEMTVDRRSAGNSDAPTNSSESSGQQKPEADSTPSIPEEMPRGALLT